MGPWIAILVLGSDPSAAVRWDAPQACPPKSEVVERIVSLTAVPSDDPAWSKVSVDVDVQPTPAGFHAELHLSTPGGRSEHRFDARRCDDVVDVVALEAALLIDAVQAAQRARPASEDAARTETGSEVVADETPSTSNAISTPAKLDGELTLLAGASVGLPERVAPVISLGGALGGRAWAVRFDVTGVVPVPVRSDGFPEEGANIGAVGLGSVGCFTPSRGRLRAALCGGAEGGLFVAEGFGVRDPQRVVRPYVAARLDAELGVDVASRLSLLLRASTPVLLLRPRFGISGLGELYRAPIVSFRGFLGLRVGLGPNRGSRARRGSKSRASTNEQPPRRP